MLHYRASNLTSSTTMDIQIQLIQPLIRMSLLYSLHLDYLNYRNHVTSQQGFSHMLHLLLTMMTIQAKLTNSLIDSSADCIVFDVLMVLYIFLGLVFHLDML